MLLVQGVRNIYDTNETKGGEGNGNEGKLVLIGKGVDQGGMRASLMATLAMRS